MFDVGVLVPIVALVIPIVAIISNAWSDAQANRTRADQRMAMLARGIPLAEIEAVLNPEGPASSNGSAISRDPFRSLNRARRSAIVLISVGIGLIAFFVALELVLGDRDIFSGAAIGLIPLLIGIGFVVDYHLQKRDLSRFGLEVDADPRRD